MKQKIFWIVISITVISSACILSSSAMPENSIFQPSATHTPLPPIIIQITPTRSIYAAEEANAGMHRYWMSPNEIDCEASEDTKYAQFRDKEHIFETDYSSVMYGGRTYPRVGENRYQSINQDEKPLVLVYSEHGFILYIYKPGQDPDVDDWCLTFSFTLSD